MTFVIGHKKIIGSGMKKGFKHSDETKRKMSIFQKGKVGLVGNKNPRFGKPAWNRGVPRDAETKKKISETKIRNKVHAKEKNNFWKGGVKKARIRYKLIYLPTHPNCHKSGYVSEHRFVMEKHIGRYLTKEEVVHHINNNRLDNRIENLHLFKNTGEHSYYHARNIK